MEIPGEKLVIKLWETLADKGIGNLLKPWQIRREGRASVEVRRDELLALAQAESDVAAIRSGQKMLLPSGDLVDRPALPAPTLFVERVDSPPLALAQALAIVSQNAKADTIRQEVAVAKAVLHAEEELSNDPSPPSEEKPEEDWLVRWRECAAAVSSEELQGIWGKVLAGEVKSPGRFSLRTLEFLRNLSQVEAKAIERIIPFVLSGVVFRGPGSVLEAEGVTFSHLLAMQELGVLTGVDGLGLEVNWGSDLSTSFQKVLTSHGAALWVTALDSAKVVKLKACNVTAIGNQVLRLGNFSPNQKMLESVANAVKAQGFEVQIGSYVLVAEDQLQAFNLRSI